MYVTPPSFDLYAGIDWSGAKGARHPGIQVAVCPAGDAPPRLLAAADGRRWSRSGVLDWLVAQAGCRRVLAGFDFASAYAWLDRGAYFPGSDAPEPADAPALWALVEQVCAADPALYGGAFYQRDDLPFHRHFLSPRGLGDLYTYRQRTCERACAGVTTPHPVMKCIGAANVGTGSLAGMRLLHRLARDHADAVALWPFADSHGGRSVVVESFPRLYYMLAGADPRAWADPATIDRALGVFGSRPMPAPFRAAREDEADAVVLAAGLRHLAEQPAAWAPPRMAEAARLREGWIFGVE